MLESEESSSSDENENQELAEVSDKRQGTSQGQISDSSRNGTKIRTLAPRSS